MLVACGCALVFGFVPALRSARIDLVSVMNQLSPWGAARERLRAVLTVFRCNDHRLRWSGRDCRDGRLGAPAAERLPNVPCIVRRAAKTEREFFKWRHTTKLIWGAHRIIYVFTDATGNLSLYYDIELKEPLETNTTGARCFRKNGTQAPAALQF